MELIILIFLQSMLQCVKEFDRLDTSVHCNITAVLLVHAEALTFLKCIAIDTMERGLFHCELHHCCIQCICAKAVQCNFNHYAF